MSEDENSWLKEFLRSEFQHQKEERQRDKEDLKQAIVTYVKTHKEECEGYILASSLNKAVKLAKVIYVALPTSIILAILGFLRAFLHF